MNERHDIDAPIWHTVKTAAKHTGVGQRGILDALRAGDLKGNQRVTGGTWRLHCDDLDAWMRGETPAWAPS